MVSLGWSLMSSVFGASCWPMPAKMLKGAGLNRIAISLERSFRRLPALRPLH